MREFRLNRDTLQGLLEMLPEGHRVMLCRVRLISKLEFGHVVLVFEFDFDVGDLVLYNRLFLFTVFGRRR